MRGETDGLAAAPAEAVSEALAEQEETVGAPTLLNRLRNKVVGIFAPSPDELLAEVLASPLLDPPREQYADRLRRAGDPRGEFIQLQLQCARVGTAASTDWREADRLRHRFGREWAAPLLDYVKGYQFHRGFVELVRMPAADFLQHADLLFALAPILHLDLTEAREVAGTLFGSPHLMRIRSLSLEDCDLGDDEVVCLAKSLFVGQLRWLSLAQNYVDREGVEALATSTSLRNLRYLDLSGNLFDPTEQYAHDGGLIVSTWLPEEARGLEELSRRELPWLRGASTSLNGETYPDRFRMAALEEILATVAVAPVASVGAEA